MIPRARVVAGAATLMTILAAVVTWPRTLEMATAIDPHHDSLFSIWRVGWIAHALSTDPVHLFDANIFHPAKGTLAYSDALLLEGLLAAPALWAGAPPILVYNLLLTIGFAGSGVAMFLLAHYLTKSMGASLVAGAAFTIAPYRIEHLMHLELQWAMWVPLTLWALHRAVDESSVRFGVLAGVLFWLQMLSCVYYGVFLAMMLCAFVPLLLAVSSRRAAALLPLTFAVLTASLLTVPYALPYMQAAREVGTRDLSEVAEYSARPISYLTAAGSSRLWGWTADRWGAPELRLFPGLIVLVLAAIGLTAHPRRRVIVYTVTALVVVELSFGLHGVFYGRLLDAIPPLTGFRATARFGLLASACLSVLAAFGAQALARGKHASRFAVPVMLTLMVVDSSNLPMSISHEDVTREAPLYKVIRSGEPGAVLELPVPNPNFLPGRDPYYAVWSMQHWKPLINGYSGYYPDDYLTTMVRMESFPNEASMARLRTLNVRYLVVHRAFYDPAEYTAMLLRTAGEPAFKSWGVYRDPFADAALFVLEQ